MGVNHNGLALRRANGLWSNIGNIRPPIHRTAHATPPR